MPKRTLQRLQLTEDVMVIPDGDDVVVNVAGVYVDRMEHTERVFVVLDVTDYAGDPEAGDDITVL